MNDKLKRLVIEVFLCVHETYVKADDKKKDVLYQAYKTFFRPESTPEERDAAVHTLAEAMFPESPE